MIRKKEKKYKIRPCERCQKPFNPQSKLGRVCPFCIRKPDGTLVNQKMLKGGRENGNSRMDAR